MILTEKQKHFIISNREMLSALFLSRIEQLKDEVTNDLPGEKTTQKILLIHEFKAWLKDMETMANPVAPKNNNLI
jgi:SpoVK/Ycf46/Vps4 family AAA+-type ATPase